MELPQFSCSLRNLVHSGIHTYVTLCARIIPPPRSALQLQHYELETRFVMKFARGFTNQIKSNQTKQITGCLMHPKPTDFQLLTLFRLLIILKYMHNFNRIKTKWEQYSSSLEKTVSRKTRGPANQGKTKLRGAVVRLNRNSNFERVKCIDVMFLGWLHKDGGCPKEFWKSSYHNQDKRKSRYATSFTEVSIELFWKEEGGGSEKFIFSKSKNYWDAVKSLEANSCGYKFGGTSSDVRKANAVWEKKGQFRILSKCLINLHGPKTAGGSNSRYLIWTKANVSIVGMKVAESVRTVLV